MSFFLLQPLYYNTRTVTVDFKLLVSSHPRNDRMSMHLYFDCEISDPHLNQGEWKSIGTPVCIVGMNLGPVYVLRDRFVVDTLGGLNFTFVTTIFSPSDGLCLIDGARSRDDDIGVYGSE